MLCAQCTEGVTLWFPSVRLCTADNGWDGTRQRGKEGMKGRLLTIYLECVVNGCVETGP